MAPLVQIQSLTVEKPIPLSASLRFEHGISALVGETSDGPSTLLAALAKRIPIASGSFSFSDGATFLNDRHVAYIPIDVSVPLYVRAGEWLKIASALRKEPPSDPIERLRSFQLEALAEQPLGALSREMLRALALIEALTSHVVCIILLEEIETDLERPFLRRIEKPLFHFAEKGSILFSTASLQEAVQWADTLFLMQDGEIASSLSASSPQTFMQDCRFQITTSPLADFVNALAEQGWTSPIVSENGQIELEGGNPIETAKKIGKAVLRAKCTVSQMRAIPVSHSRRS